MGMSKVTVVSTDKNKPQKVSHLEVESYLVEEAYVESGVYIDPPAYEYDIIQNLEVNPKMKCWGKGLK